MQKKMEIKIDTILTVSTIQDNFKLKNKFWTILEFHALETQKFQCLGFQDNLHTELQNKIFLWSKFVFLLLYLDAAMYVIICYQFYSKIKIYRTFF